MSLGLVELNVASGLLFLRAIATRYMGQLRFLVPQPQRVSPPALETAYVCGRDDLPWVGRVLLRGNELLLDREVSESGTFNILWTVAGRGPLVLSTATLMERPEPYHLPLELARGTLNRLRNQLAAWESAGMEPPEGIASLLIAALHNFVQGAVGEVPPDQAAELAERSLQASLDAIDTLASDYALRIFTARQRQTPKVVPLVGARLGDAVPKGGAATDFTAAFNAAAVPFDWGRIEHHEGRHDWSLYDQQVQWCQGQSLRICGGPLIEFQRRSLPDWLFLWEGDFENLLSVAGDHVRSVVTRYRGKVDFWSAAGRLMSGESLGLDEEQRLRLVVRAIEVIRDLDPQTPVIVSVDQPWAEYLSRRESDLPALHFADALVRGDLGLAGIGLELNVGVGPKATLPRDKFEISRQLDRFAALGLPLIVWLAVPSAGYGFTPQAQKAWVEDYASLILARQAVQALFWNQLRDAEAGDFPDTGLIDAQGRPKPSFEALAALRKLHSA